MDFVLEDTKNGYKTMKCSINEQYKYLHSKYDPQKEAEKFVDDMQMKRNAVVIVFGMGLGYYGRALLEHMPKINKLLCIEPSPEIFNVANQGTDMKELFDDGRLRLCFAEREGDISLFLENNIGWDEIGNAVVVSHPLYDEMFGKEYLEFLKAWKASRNQLAIDRNTAVYHSESWQERIYDNYAYLFDSADYMALHDSFKGMPMVLVSAGPSLNRNVALLSEMKGKIPIVCVYTAYKVLLNHHIEPDIIVSIDSVQLQHESEEEKTREINTPLLCSMVTDSELMKKHTGIKMFMVSPTDSMVGSLYREMKKECYIFETGGSVACVALDFARFTGANPIVLVGQDFAYAGKKTHAAGTYYDTLDEKGLQEDGLLLIDDIYGGKVFTDAIFYSFKKWFDKYIQRNCETKFIDATEGGAKIEGTVIMNLRDVIDQYADCSVDAENIIREACEKSPLLPEHVKIKVYENLLKNIKLFEKSKEELENAVEVCKKLLRLYQKGEQSAHQKTIEKHLEKLDVIDNNLKEFRENAAYFDLIFNKIRFLLENYDTKMQKGNDQYILNRNLILYIGLLQMVNAIMPGMKNAAAKSKKKLK